MPGFQQPITIHNALERITRSEFLLPAFQREFIWRADQIERLFDSLMQGYPISSMLFWKVKGSTKANFRFYHFLTKYIQHHHTHNDVQHTEGRNDFHAILDGQQRLTALYIGLCSSYAYKEHRRSKTYSEWSYPTRHLYLNLSKTMDAEEGDAKYQFNFLNKADTQEQDIIALPDNTKWFRAGVVLSIHKADCLDEFAESNRLSKEEKKLIRTLERIIHNEYTINYYEEDDQEPDKAVNIFVRINSGGTYLSFSDILFSIAIASWKTKDARTEINTLVDNVRAKGYNIDKDYILKAFLYLYHKDVRFRINSFNNQFIAHIEANWEAIRNAVLSLFDVLKGFGLTDYSLTSKYATLPILYFLYHNNIYADFATTISRVEDRRVVRKWLYTVLVRRTFGGQTDTVLSQSRSAFTKDIEASKIQTSPFFPSLEINAEIKKLTEIGDDYIEELLLTQKDSQYSFPLLAMLYPHLDYNNNNFHQDHLHPEAAFRHLLEVDKKELGWAVYNSVCNLQMLDANENMSKNAKSLKTWIETQTATYDSKQFCESHVIPQNVSYEITGFRSFIQERRKLLVAKLKELLN
jgi:uncharacterized protein with ParB-like and HNH nuclease domain